MSYTCGGGEAEANAKLLIQLMQETGALDLGSIANFFQVGSDWHCPSCHRSKAEQARLDKNRNLMCAIHSHHDHMVDAACEKMPGFHRDDLPWQDRRGYDSLRSNFNRFTDTLICNDCNVVEGDAKRKCGAPAAFSFTPFEISTFIIVTNNAAHTLDIAKAQETWQHIRPSLGAYREELRKISNYDKDPDSFEAVGGAAWRVLKDIRAKMKKVKGDD